jgi:hypothetical protein
MELMKNDLSLGIWRVWRLIWIGWSHGHIKCSKNIIIICTCIQILYYVSNNLSI